MNEIRTRVKEVLSGVRQPNLTNEAAVERNLIDPCFAALGWRLANGVNMQVGLRLSPERAKFWTYPSGQMRRDYVLPRTSGGPLHVEAKHNWPRHTFHLEPFLERASQDDWSGSQRDGMRKDLALLLWGARSQGGTRAAIIDNLRILVFDWSDRWSIRSEAEIFTDRADKVADAFCLLLPSGGEEGCEA